MISKIQSAVLNGLEVIATEVEVAFTQGVPGVVIVGLPDNAVKESKERLRLAIRNSNIEYPAATKIVVNLSPADVRKEGSALDLPIAVGIIKNRHHLENPFFAECLFYGELNLTGELNRVKGVLNIALFAKENGFKALVIPFENRYEASFVKGIAVYPLKNLSEVMGLIATPEQFPPFCSELPRRNETEVENDFNEVKGQYLAKRVMEIAAAGFHNVLMIGPPGSGKSMISKALASIIPEMNEDEILETSLIYSAAGLLAEKGGLLTSRPFRSPHHTISDIGLSGGGKFPCPGEISLAHNGVLFLDELPYFKKSALEVLRQPLEDGKITISRSLISFTFPARFMLVAAMNPCEDSIGITDSEYYQCTSAQKRVYYSKISKPLLDRIDLQIEVKKVKLDDITSPIKSEASSEIRKRVDQARQSQLDRFQSLKKKIFANGQMKNPEIRKFCPIDSEGQNLLKTAMDKFNLSARAYFKILKISRTVADLDFSPAIQIRHLQEALQYRALDFSKF